MGRASSLFFAAVMIAASVASAGNIDYLTNRSVSYFRNFTRNSATDGADLVSYNPAGLVHMGDGLHLSFGNEFFLKDYEITVEDPYWETPAEDAAVTYESTEPTLFFPDLYAVYRTGDLALFGAFTVPAGGGSLDYPDGIYSMPLVETGLQQALRQDTTVFALMDEGWIEASSQYLAGTLGASYLLTECLSAGLAGRYVTARRSYEGAGTFTILRMTAAGPVPIDTSERLLDCEKTASGFAGIISLNAKPTECLNIALRYETATALEFETSVDENSWAPYGLPDSTFTDGYQQRRDLPAMLSGGVSYRVSDGLRLGTMWNYYFVDAADQGEDDGIRDDYENGWDLGVGADIGITPDLLGGLGYVYSDLGGSRDTFDDFEYNLDCHCIGGGFRYSVSPDLAVTLAGGRNIYLQGEGSGPYEACTFDKRVWYFGLGAEVTIR